jgi:hypothetical protein
MNSRQKKVLLIGGALVSLMLLFPPWDYLDPDTSGRQSAGFHFFLTPPKPRSAEEVFGQARFPHMVHVRLSELQLIVQLLITIPTVVGLAFLFRSERSLVTVALRILCLLVPAFIVGFIIWVVVS